MSPFPETATIIMGQWHSGIWWAADEVILNDVQKHNKKNPPLKKRRILIKNSSAFPLLE